MKAIELGIYIIGAIITYMIGYGKWVANKNDTNMICKSFFAGTTWPVWILADLILKGIDWVNSGLDNIYGK